MEAGTIAGADSSFFLYTGTAGTPSHNEIDIEFINGGRTLHTNVWTADRQNWQQYAVSTGWPGYFTELLEWQWTIHGEPPTLLRVELTPVPGGTLLVLDHSRLPVGQWPGLSAGWHDFLDVLGTGRPSGEDRWKELLPAYREQVAAV